MTVTSMSAQYGLVILCYFLVTDINHQPLDKAAISKAQESKDLCGKDVSDGSQHTGEFQQVTIRVPNLV